MGRSNATVNFGAVPFYCTQCPLQVDFKDLHENHFAPIALRVSLSPQRDDSVDDAAETMLTDVNTLQADILQ